MKNRTSLAISFTAAILLSGCSGAGSPAPTVTETVTVQPEPDVTEEEADVAEATDGEGIDTDNPETSPRGKIIKEIGEKAGVTTADGEPIVTFTVNDIRTGQCTDSMAESPQNGHMLFVDMTLTTAPNLLKEYGGEFSPIYGWTVVKQDGTTSNADMNTTSTMFCLPDAQTIPDYVGPGQTVKGTVVLDVPSTSGILVFNESFIQPVGWEWKYDVK